MRWEVYGDSRKGARIILKNPERNDLLQEIHRRIVADEPDATLDAYRAVAQSLETHLKYEFPHLPPGADPDMRVEAIHIALTDYFRFPEKYDPAKSRLMTYLKMAARGDMLNLLKRERRHSDRRSPLDDVAFRLPDGEEEISETIGRDWESRSLMKRLARDLSDEDMRLLRLMMDKVRGTPEAAEALGIEHLPFDEQRKEVKKAKDRIRKKLRRRL